MELLPSQSGGEELMIEMDTVFSTPENRSQGNIIDGPCACDAILWTNTSPKRPKINMLSKDYEGKKLQASRCAVVDRLLM